MATIGSLGSLITFEVSDKKILTFKDLQVNASGSWSYHDIISKKPRSEFNGAELKDSSFSIVLSAEHGVKPRETLDKIVKAVESGTVMSFTLGGKIIGSNWIIKSNSGMYDIVMNKGEVAKATVKITLEEYVVSVSKKEKKSTSKKKKYKVGDIVTFNGGKHYVSSCKGARGSKAKAGKAKITIINHNTHPYHLIRTSGSKSNVYGWVNAGSFK